LVLADELYCTYYQGDIKKQIDGKLTEKLVHICRMANGIRYELPNEIMRQISEMGNTLVSGRTKLRLRELVVNDDSEYMISRTSFRPGKFVERGDEYGFLDTEEEPKRALGTRQTLVVRVLSSNGVRSPQHTKEELAEIIFGTNTTTFASQYKACSNGKIQFLPGTVETVDTNDSIDHNEVPGVVDLILEDSLDGQHFDIATEFNVNRVFEAQFGKLDAYDHVLFCLPQGMNNEFIAFALLNDNLSYYSDPWCTMLSATMHEVGHNLGARHSGELGEEEYDDKSCTMGIGYGIVNGPKKCFNGQKLWFFDWFPDQKFSITPNILPWTGNLAAFVDADLNRSLPVVIRVDNLYLVYNRATKHNIEVNEKGDLVTVVKAESPSSPSWMIKGLSSEAYHPHALNHEVQFTFGTTSYITIEVCAIKNSDDPNVADYARISIHAINETSTCDDDSKNYDELSAAPSTSPTKSILMASGCTGFGNSCYASAECCGSKSRCVEGQLEKVCASGSNSNRKGMSSVGNGGGFSGNKMMRRQLISEGGRKVGRFRKSLRRE